MKALLDRPGVLTARTATLAVPALAAPAFGWTG